MTIAIPTFYNDSTNIRVPAATFTAPGIPIVTGAYSTDYESNDVFLMVNLNFSKVALELNNIGENSVDYQISGKIKSPPTAVPIDETWVVLPSSGEDSLDSKANKIIFVDDAYSYLLIRFKETVSGSDSVINFYSRSIN